MIMIRVIVYFAVRFAKKRSPHRCSGHVRGVGDRELVWVLGAELVKLCDRLRGSRSVNTLVFGWDSEPKTIVG